MCSFSEDDFTFKRGIVWREHDVAVDVAAAADGRRASVHDGADDGLEVLLQDPVDLKRLSRRDPPAEKAKVESSAKKERRQYLRLRFHTKHTHTHTHRRFRERSRKEEWKRIKHTQRLFRSSLEKESVLAISQPFGVLHSRARRWTLRQGRSPWPYLSQISSKMWYRAPGTSPDGTLSRSMNL